MTRKKTSSKHFESSAAVTPQEAASLKEGKPAAGVKRKGSSLWIYAVVFLLFYAFCGLAYGDVFARAAEANFITGDSTSMDFLTDRPWGWLYVWGRWALLVFKSPALGAALLSLVFTLIVVFTDRLFRLPMALRGAGSLVVGGLLAWILSLGYNLWYKDEPSLFILVSLFVLLIVGLLYAVSLWVCKKRTPVFFLKTRLPLGLLVAVLVVASSWFAADRYNQNVILTSRMQMKVMKGDWDGMIEDALGARKPSRSVAAYYAIALVQTNQLIQRLFDIPFAFPEERFRPHDGNNEYGLFLADCNFYAGITNISYRCAFDHMVMNGPSVYIIKQMILSSIMNGDDDLARKYMKVLGQVPFEHAFIDKYTPYIGHREMIESDPQLSLVRKMRPMERHFEQNYRSPAFLGYNAGLLQGSDETLVTAIAAILYSKELSQCMQHIAVYRDKFTVLPSVLQQAVTIQGNKDPQVAAMFADIIASQGPTLQAFVRDAKPLLDERMAKEKGKSKEEAEKIKEEYNARLRAELRDPWLGSYYYYYYFENNDPSQLRKEATTGVN